MQPPLDPAIDACTTLATLLTTLDVVNDDSKLDTTLFSSLTGAIGDIQSSLNNITDTIKDKYLNDIEKQIQEVEDELGRQNENIANAVNQVYDVFEDQNISYDGLDEYLDMFSLSLKLVGSVLTILVIIMMIALVLGLISTPGEKMAKASGSIFRICIGIFLVLGVLFFLILVVFFIVGAFSTRFVCQTLEDPESSDIIRLIDYAFTDQLNSIFGSINQNSASEINITLTLTSLIQGLQAGTAIFPLLQLNQILDVNDLAENWKTEYNIEQLKSKAKVAIGDSIDGLIDLQNTFDAENSTIIGAGKAADELLTDLVPKILAIDLPDEILTSFPKLDVTGLQEKVNDTFIGYYDDSTSTYEFTLEQEFTSTINFLDEKFDYFGGDGRSTILDFFEKNINDLLGIMDGYLFYAVGRLQCNIGSTVPLGNIYASTDEILCKQVIDPFNAGNYDFIKP